MTQRIATNRTAVTVIAINDFNRQFGIVKGESYKATKIETIWAEETVLIESAKNLELGTFVSISYEIDGLDYESDDFVKKSS